MQEQPGTVRLALDDGIGRITLDRPRQSNSIDLAMAQALQAVSHRCLHDATVRAVILDARGDRFCVGGDLKAFVDAGDGVGALIDEITSAIHEAVLNFLMMDAVLITCVDGAAAGAGMSLALAGDIVLGTRRATFVPAYAAAGLSPDCGMTFLLPRLIGDREARNVLLFNRKVSADEALRLGMISAVVDEAQLESTAVRRAQEIADGPRESHGAIKRLLLASFTSSLISQLEAEAKSIARLAVSPAGQEGMRAAIEKRKPDFNSSRPGKS